MKTKHFTSSALILQNNKVLLVEHKKLGVWLYPGGHIEKHENPDEALIREVREETGLDVEIISNKDDSLSNKEEDVSSLHIPFAILCELVGDHYHNDLIYLCRIKNKEIILKKKNDESNDIAFFDKNEIKDIKLFNNFRTLLEKVLKYHK